MSSPLQNCRSGSLWKWLTREIHECSAIWISWCLPAILSPRQWSAGQWPDRPLLLYRCFVGQKWENSLHQLCFPRQWENPLHQLCFPRHQMHPHWGSVELMVIDTVTLTAGGGSPLQNRMTRKPKDRHEGKSNIGISYMWRAESLWWFTEKHTTVSKRHNHNSLRLAMKNLAIGIVICADSVGFRQKNLIKQLETMLKFWIYSLEVAWVLEFCLWPMEYSPHFHDCF